MKEQFSKLMANLHYFILAYALFSLYVQWDEHSVALQNIVSQEPAVAAEIATLKSKVKAIQEASKRTNEFKARVEDVAKSIETVQRQLPAEINDSDILNFFNQEISALNLKDASIVPGLEQPSTYFISKEYSLKLKGTFLQILIFLERIGTATRIYNIKELRLVTQEDLKKGKFQMLNAEGVIQAYRFNPDFKVDRGFEKVEKE